MAETIDSIVAFSTEPRIPMSSNEPHFAAYCEIQDASEKVAGADLTAAPGAAVIEIAKLLTQFDGQIDDEHRATLIMLGGALLRLSDQLQS